MKQLDSENQQKKLNSPISKNKESSSYNSDDDFHVLGFKTKRNKKSSKNQSNSISFSQEEFSLIESDLEGKGKHNKNIKQDNKKIKNYSNNLNEKGFNNEDNFGNNICNNGLLNTIFKKNKNMILEISEENMLNNLNSDFKCNEPFEFIGKIKIDPIYDYAHSSNASEPIVVTPSLILTDFSSSHLKNA